MKRLYRVDVEFSGYVMAEDESTARRFAIEICSDVEMFGCAHAVEVQHTDRIDPAWSDPDSEPYGADDDQTLAEAWPKPPSPPESPPVFPDLRPVLE